MKAIIGDITKLSLDAIVNAANKTLMGGCGVDGAIHNAAGPELNEACMPIGGCPTGEARITPGFLLPSKYIIHTVGPVWHGGSQQEKALLKSCYLACLEIAERHPEISSIAFPCISTGVYRFPADIAASIAVDTCRNSPLDITFCCYLKSDYELYLELLK